MKKIVLLNLFIFIVLMISGCNVKFITDEDDKQASVFTFERLFDDENYKEITIRITTFEWERFIALQRQNLEDYNTVRIDEYIASDLIYKDSLGETIIEDIGIRNRGNTSIDMIVDDQNNPKIAHFKLNFRYDFKGTKPEYSKRRGFGLKELDLKYNKNSDPTYMSENFSMEMFQHYDQNAQETSHALLYLEIGGVKYAYGLYTIFEPIDDVFIERRFEKEHDKGDLYKVLWQGYGPASLQGLYDPLMVGEETLLYHPNYDLKTNNDILENKHSKLKSFISQINKLEGDIFEQYITKLFDVPSFLKYLAINVYLGNPDDYRAMGNNYYLYLDPVENQWLLIPYDYDHSVGVGWNPQGNFTIGLDIYEWMNQMAILTWDSYYQPILVQKILGIPKFKTLYTTYIETIYNDSYFTFDNFYSRYLKTKNLYKDKVSETMIPVQFTRGNSEWYIENKRADIQNQLNQYL